MTASKVFRSITSNGMKTIAMTYTKCLSHLSTSRSKCFTTQVTTQWDEAIVYPGTREALFLGKLAKWFILPDRNRGKMQPIEIRLGNDNAAMLLLKRSSHNLRLKWLDNP
ncbi:hypothetical protein N7513_006228 [Penicillium frequentans]|nr:hypothetical protein N7513_006228 [Penicillium glabrum]